MIFTYVVGYAGLLSGALRAALRAVLLRSCFGEQILPPLLQKARSRNRPGLFFCGGRILTYFVGYAGLLSSALRAALRAVLLRSCFGEQILPLRPSVSFVLFSGASLRSSALV